MLKSPLLLFIAAVICAARSTPAAGQEDFNRQQRETAESDAPQRPAVPLLNEDVNYWLRQFGGESALAELWRRETGARPPEPLESSKTLKEPSEKDVGPLDNPFPPGYGEDLLADW